MENTTNSVIYTVNSDLDDGILYAEFETKEAAMDYAKRNMDKLPFIDELEVSRDADGDIDEVFSSKTIWAHNELEYPTNEFVDDEDDDYWAELENMYNDEQDGKHVIGDTTWFEGLDTSDTNVEKPEDVKYLRQAQTKTPQASDAGNTLSKKALKKADLKNTDDLVETLEENEDEVECKECFDLFPKADCIKVDLGYICPTCAECGTVSEDDIFKIDFPEYEKMSFGNDMIPEEPMPADEVPTETPIVTEPEEEIENNPISTPEEAVPFLVKDEEEAIAGYEQAAEIVEDSDLENKEEILDTIEHIKEEEEEHIEELTDLVDTKEDTESTADDDEIIDVENDPVSDPAVPVETETPLNEDATPTRYWMLYFDGNDVGVTEAADEDEAMRYFEDYYSDEYHFDSTDHDWGVDEITEEEYETYDGDSFGGYYTYDNTFDMEFDRAVDAMREHVNQENPAVESDQELEGTDNAVEKCKTNPVVTHSKDDLPLDSCDHEKLTEASADDLNQIFKLCKEIGIKTGSDLNRFVKDEVAEGQSLLDALKAYRDDLGAEFQIGEDLEESAVLAGVATGVIVDVVKRIMDKAGDHKKKSKWIDFRKHIIEKTPEGQINIWNHDSEQVASDLKTVAAAKEKIKELNQKAKDDKKAAKKNKNKPTETDQEQN